MSDKPDTEPGEPLRPDERTGDEDIEIPVQPEAQPVREEAAERIDISELGEDDIREAVQKAEERDRLYDKFLRARAELENWVKRGLERSVLEAVAREVFSLDLTGPIQPLAESPGPT